MKLMNSLVYNTFIIEMKLKCASELECDNVITILIDLHYRMELGKTNRS